MRREIKNGLIFIAVRIGLFITGRLPDAVAGRVAFLLGKAALTLAKHERALAEKQLKRAFPGRLTRRRRAVLLAGMAHGLGQNAIEAVRLLNPRSAWPEVIFPQSAKRALDQALARGKGVVFVTGHFGNWELMAAWLAREGYPIHTVVKQSYDPRLTGLIDRARQTLGVKTIFRGATGAATAMLRALRNGGILGFLIDQDTDVPSVYVPFFDRLAKTPVGPAVLATRYGVPMVVGAIHREVGGAHRIEIAPCPETRTLLETTSSATRCLEACIRRHPSQWVWFHNRWKSHPETAVG